MSDPADVPSPPVASPLWRAANAPPHGHRCSRAAPGTSCRRPADSADRARPAAQADPLPQRPCTAPLGSQPVVRPAPAEPGRRGSCPHGARLRPRAMPLGRRRGRFGGAHLDRWPARRIGFWGVHRLARALRLGTPWPVHRGDGVTCSARPASRWSRSGRDARCPSTRCRGCWCRCRCGSPRHSPRRCPQRPRHRADGGGVGPARPACSCSALPVLWFLTARRLATVANWRRRWAGGVVAATAWWVLPLALQGTYGYSFTDYTESATCTTMRVSSGPRCCGAPATGGPTSPTWSALASGGWEMIAGPGGHRRWARRGGCRRGGLARRDLVERRWLTLCRAGGRRSWMVAATRGRSAAGSSTAAASRRSTRGASEREQGPADGGASRSSSPRSTCWGSPRLGSAGCRTPRTRPSSQRPAGRRSRRAGAGGAVAVALGGYRSCTARAGADGHVRRGPDLLAARPTMARRPRDGKTSVVIRQSSFGELHLGPTR